MSHFNSEKPVENNSNLSVNTEKKRVWILIGLSLAYLVIELGFSAELLATAWKATDIADVEKIEHVGRMISGFAVWLAFFGVVYLKAAEKNVVKTVSIMILIVLPLTVTFVYKGQEAWVNSMVDKSTNEEVKSAFYGSLLTRAYKSGQVELTDISFNREGNNPDGAEMAFGALMPYFILNVSGLESKLESKAKQIIRAEILKQSEPPEWYYNEHYTKNRNLLTEKYNAYVEGNLKYSAAISAIASERKQKWNDYRARVFDKFKKYPEQITRRHTQKVIRDEARRSMPELPMNWQIDDVKTFYQVVQNQIVRKARSTFNLQVKKAAGFSIKPNLSEASFVLLPEIQKEWKSNFKGTKLEYSPVSVNTSYKTFVRKHYEPLIDKEVNTQFEQLKAKPEDMAPGGKHFEAGQSAIKLAIVPFIALIFSLVGGVFHLAKLTGLLGKLAGIIVPLRWMASIVVLIGVSYYPLQVSNNVTDSKLFSYVGNQTGPNEKWMISWIVHLEDVYFPINDQMNIFKDKGDNVSP